MSNLLELLGKALESPFMALVLPRCRPLSASEVRLLSEETGRCPEHIANMLRLGIHYSQSGSAEQAEQLFGQVLSADPKHLDTRLAWAAMYCSSGSLDDALAQFEKAYEDHGNDSRVLMGLGHCHERLGESDQALEYYRQAADVLPYLRQAHERMAAIHLHRGDCVQAIEQYEKLRQEHPEDAAVYMILGQLQLQMGQYGPAAASFERALTIEPDNFELHDDKVESLAKSGRVAEAIESLRGIIDEQGDFPDSYVRLGDLYAQTGNDEAAVMNYSRALELYPGYLEAAVKLGTQHLRMSRFYEAASNFSQAFEINDQLIVAYVGLGVAQMHNNQVSTGKDTIALAVSLEPNTNLLFAETVRLQMKLSLAQKHSGGFAQPGLYESPSSQELDDLLTLQIERHRQSLLENPNRADLHYRYGLLLRGRGRTRESISHFREALKINPCYAKARIKLALALLEDGRSEEAMVNLEEALHVKEEFVKLHYKLGLMYCDKIQFALAVEHSELTLGQDSNADTNANLMLALQNMGLIDRARATWQAVCELEPDSRMAFQSQRAIMPIKTLH